jgi:toluene monooxygenase electron transfer component
MTYRVTVAPDGPTFDIGAGERILDAARQAGVWLPYECGWGSCSTCKVTLVEGKVELLFPNAPALTERDERRRRILVCQSGALSDLVLRPQRFGDSPDPLRPTVDAEGRVIGIQEEGPEIFRLVLDIGEARPFRPGQYAIIAIGGVRRCYSMANVPGGTELEFVFKRYQGPGSTSLAKLRPGDRVSLALPYGDMWVREGGRPILLIAGGTGVAPILGMARHLVQAGDRRRVAIVYGAATIAELVMRDELECLAARLDRGSLHPVVADPPPHWSGVSGFVTDALADIVAELDGPPVVYLAGPPAMIHPTLDVLANEGVELDAVHYDSFG